MTFSEHYTATLSLTANVLYLRYAETTSCIVTPWPREAGTLGIYSTNLVTKQMYRLRYAVILH